MPVSDAVRGELEAIEEERACTDLSSWRKTTVGGSDARAWLQDLVTADVGSLTEGSARRSLLLTPTGRIRADFTVAMHVDHPDVFLLFQDPRQPDPIDLLLEPYVLSSDVQIRDVTDELALYAALGGAAGRIGWAGTRPSAVGSGMDVMAAEKNAWRLADMMMKKQLTEVGDESLEIWRVRKGLARFGHDFDETSSPAEAGLVEETVDLTKGCFLGQEAVAKVRNLGHPARILRSLRSDVELEPGAAVLAGSVEVGEITSAAPAVGDEPIPSIARIRWEAAEAPLTTAEGVRLERAGEKT